MKTQLRTLTFAAMLLAIGLVLPFLTGHIPEIGGMLLPLHLPVLLCGLICGWKYGLAVGVILPIMRSMIFAMPPMYPNAVVYAFELATYGFVIGILYEKAKWQCIRSLYRCMIAAMLAGRIVWGIAKAVTMGLAGKSFTLAAFIAGGFTEAIPGIILQLLLIPAIMLLLDKTHLVPFKKHKKASEEAACI